MINDESNFTIHIKEKFNGDLYFEKDPDIECVTREELVSYYKYFLSGKPKQIPVNEYQVKECDSCNFEGTIHKKQTFCPICKSIVNILDEDPNFSYDEIFQEWQKKKNLIESMINGDVVGFLEKINSGNDLSTDPYYMGEEIIVDEEDEDDPRSIVDF